MLLKLKQIDVPPGQKIFLKDINWSDFEDILKELGEHRAARIAYENSTLEIMTPLPEHERNKEYISDLVKVLLEERDLEFCCLGSTTFRNQKMLQGVEPDNCFYIQNEALVRNKNCIDLAVDPPPDLALEIDVTSRTHHSIYEALGVPELWRFERGELQLNILRNGKYTEVEDSPTFPGLPLKEVIPQFLKQCQEEGRNKTMKAFRAWARNTIDS